MRSTVPVGAACNRAQPHAVAGPDDPGRGRTPRRRAAQCEVRPRVVKIDVEGAEEGVLWGGIDVITTHRPLILLEHAVDAASLFGTAPEQLHDALCNEFGYELFGLDGDGQYNSEGFAGLVRAGERYNFAAWPRG